MATIKKKSTAERKFNELMLDNSLQALECKLELTKILIKMGYEDGLNNPLAKDIYVNALLLVAGSDKAHEKLIKFL